MHSQCKTMRVSSTRNCPVRRVPLRVQCAVSDNSVRVHGKLKKVFKYVTNFQYLENWYQGVSQSQKLGGPTMPVTVGTRFQVQLQIATYKYPTIYEIVDFQPDRKVVYAASSEFHKSTDQLIFLQDPNDVNFTIVRYMADVQAKKFKVALEPIFAGAHKHTAEHSLYKLAALFNSPHSPIRYMEDDDSNKFSPKWNIGQFFTGGQSKGSQRANENSSRAPNNPFVNPASGPSSADILGYYQLLGLDPRGATPDAIKGAYRQLALQLHPDRLNSSGSFDTDDNFEESLRRFQMIKKAYEVLKDPETRRLYDQGKPLQQGSQY